jgi:L-ascorbate metabolism protein UlaG (beta-lactamase superfamily)
MRRSSATRAWPHDTSRALRAWRDLTLALLLLVLFWPLAARAEDGRPACLPDMAQGPARLLKASLKPDEVRLTFVGHASFLIESARGTTAVTDYNDYVRAAVTPLIATMNRAHSTHYSNNPEAGIRHVLRGWTPDGSPARHDVTVEDMRVRNVATNIRDWSSERTVLNGNSIFVFETAEMCIAHLGHLHHDLEPEHIRALGRVDVLLVPVDGAYTMRQDVMFEVVNRLQARVIIPMHFFSPRTLERFLALARERFPVQFRETPVLTLTRATLPERPTVMVLPGR